MIVFYETNNTLQHHGVKGMKWGVRKKRDSGTNTRKKRQHENEDENKSKEKFHLTDKQKKAIKIGAAVTAAALVTYGAYKLSKSGKIDMSKFAGSAIVDKNTGLELQSKSESISSTLKAVNPKFSLFNRDYNMNCGNCAIAFEARLRGYNVEASGNPTGMTMSQIGQFFKGFKSESFKEINIDTTKLASDFTTRGKQVEQAMSQNILKQCSSSKDARGMVFFPADFGSHWVSWTKSGDKVTFHNSQNPSIDLTKQVFSHYVYHKNSSAAALTSIRLDDLDINTDNIHSVVTNVSNSARQKAEQFDSFVAKGKDFVMRY